MSVGIDKGQAMPKRAAGKQISAPERDFITPPTIPENS